MLYLIGFVWNFIEKIKNKSIASYNTTRYRRGIGNLGKGVKFNGVSTIIGLDKIEIGNNVHIGEGAYIRAEGGLFIGENTHIARKVVIYTHNHNYSGKKLPYDDTRIYKKVIIERNVWIGYGVTIIPGTMIGEGSIIGAGSIIYGNIPKFSIIGASKYNNLKKRDLDHYRKLDLDKQYGKADGK